METYNSCVKLFGGLFASKLQRKFIHELVTYSCQKSGCSYTTNTNCNFVKHMQTHQETKNYICAHPQCKNKKFQTSDALRKHNKNFEKGKIQCQLCYKLFNHAYLKKHMAEKHTNGKSF